MRIKTIKKRICLSLFEEVIELLYKMMYDVSDKSTKAGQKGNELWAIAVAFIFTKFNVLEKKEVIFMTNLAIQNKKEEINMNEKKCMYPLCTNFDPKAKVYCCNGCSWDHHDYIEIYGKNTTLENKEKNE